MYICDWVAKLFLLLSIECHAHTPRSTGAENPKINIPNCGNNNSNNSSNQHHNNFYYHSINYNNKVVGMKAGPSRMLSIGWGDICMHPGTPFIYIYMYRNRTRAAFITCVYMLVREHASRQWTKRGMQQ